MTNDVSYQCKFDKGDLIVHKGQTKVIMDKKNDEYYMKKGHGGNIKWQDAMFIDSEAESYDKVHG